MKIQMPIKTAVLRATTRFRCFAAIGILILSTAVARGGFLAGDILLDNVKGDNVQQYAPDGTLKHTFTGTGQHWWGASLTPDGNLVTAFATNGTLGSGIDIFSPSGTQIASFSTPQVGSPGDVSVFPDGTLAINDQSNSRTVLYTQGGTFVRSISLPGTVDPRGSMIQSNGRLWVTDNNQATISLELYNQGENNFNPLPGVSVLNYAAVDLVQDPVNGLWLVDGAGLTVHHAVFGALSGVNQFDQQVFTLPEISSFSTAVNGAITGIGMASDGSLWVIGQFDTNVYHYSQAGALLGSFPLVNPAFPEFLTVVPAPEQSTFVLGLLSLAAFCVLARRQFHW
jgi:hypothetical protein